MTMAVVLPPPASTRSESLRYPWRWTENDGCPSPTAGVASSIEAVRRARRRAVVSDGSSSRLIWRVGAMSFLALARIRSVTR